MSEKSPEPSNKSLEESVKSLSLEELLAIELVESLSLSQSPASADTNLTSIYPESKQPEFIAKELLISEPVSDTLAVASHEESIDNFGDFEEPVSDNDEDFGDFDQVEAVPFIQPSLITFDIIKGNLKEEALLKEDQPSLISSLLTQAFPIIFEISHSELLPLLTPHPTLIIPADTKAEWNILRNVSNGPTEAESDAGSTTKIPLKTPDTKPSLKSQIDQDDHENESTNASLDTRHQDILNAKKLCDIPETEIREMSKENVRDFIKSLNSSLGKVQMQANYWLDAKEQLVMESEMHNKMIASLVNLAQQKEKQAGAKRK